MLVQGRPKALVVLDFGLFKVHANGRVIGIQGYLIETDMGEHILIDSGFPVKYADDIARASAQDGLGAFGELLHLGPQNLVAGQLALLGLEPGDIDLQVLTHGHIDHIGGLADFSRAPIVVGAAERALARPLYFGDVRPVDWPEREYVLVERDMDLGPGLRILLAPGHTPGLLALMVDLPETGAVLLTSDAISRPDEVAEGFTGTDDFLTAQASAARLLQLADKRGAMVIYGHSPEQWPTLRKAPERYL